MFKRIVRTALEAIFPGDSKGLPSFRSLKSSGSFVREVFETSPPISVAALVSSASIFWLYALINTRGLALLSEPARALAAQEFSVSKKIPQLRLFALLLRQIGSFGWLRDESVRKEIGYPSVPSPPRSHDKGDGKTHISFRTKNETSLCLQADYLVVGSGPAGLPAAVELLKAGKRVVLIDAGPHKRPEDFTSDPYTSMRELMAPELFTVGKAVWPIIRGLVVGGTPVINSAIMVETPGDVLKEWNNPELRGIEQELAVRVGINPVVSLSKHGTLATRILGGGHEMNRAEDGCAGSSECLTGCRGGKKRSPDRVWLQEFFSLGGKLISCAVARRIMFSPDGSKAVAVSGFFQEPNQKLRGAEFEIRVKDRVLLAAGVIGTTELLLRSGMKKRLPTVGTRFMAHPGAGIVALHNQDMDDGGPTQDWSSLEYRQKLGIKFETLRLPPEIELARLFGGGSITMMHARNIKRMSNIIAVNWAQESFGTIQVLPGLGVVVRYTMHEADVRNLLVGLKIIVKKLLEDGAVEVYPGIIGMPDVLTGKDLYRIDKLFDAVPSSEPWRLTGILTHLFGGACWGEDPRNSVARFRDGLIHDTDNLHVVDASGFPKNIGVNPQFAIMARSVQITRNILNK